MAKIKITKTENWFKHQFRAREDSKLLKLKMKYKSSAPIGVYWQLVEMIYENEGEMEFDIDLLSFQLCESSEMISDIINQCFIVNDEGLTHETIIEQLELRKDLYEQKSEKGREAAKKRWGKHNEHGKDNEPIPNPMGHLYQTYTSVMGPDTREESRENRVERGEMTISPRIIAEDNNTKTTSNDVVLLTKQQAEKILMKCIEAKDKSDLNYQLDVINEDYYGLDNVLAAYFSDIEDDELFQSKVLQQKKYILNKQAALNI